MKRFLRVLGLLGITLIFFWTMLYFFQEKMIFHSTALPQDHKFAFDRPFEELFMTAPDGAVLNGLHFRADEPKGILLYSHGNAGELDSWGQWGVILAERYRYDVVIWDYRGYGKSTGERRQDKMLDDGLLFYDYCAAQFPESNITVYGRSLGGFFATHMARQRQPARMLLESTPVSILEVAKETYPFLPVDWLLRFRFQNLENMAHIQVPTYIIHGTDDNLVPFAHGERLFRASAASAKEFFPVQNGNHNDLSSFEERYFGILKQLLK
ncbi:alpha/beta hydrolase [Maribacter sp. 2307ULW6-5]|uniref:alpha/beta hydrolase n=1 Tax=Maribacter sp. 2307ULW6-5 TaxID=3386275 RepID=UPI0039BD0470